MTSFTNSNDLININQGSYNNHRLNSDASKIIRRHTKQHFHPITEYETQHFWNTFRKLNLSRLRASWTLDILEPRNASYYNIVDTHHQNELDCRLNCFTESNVHNSSDILGSNWSTNNSLITTDEVETETEGGVAVAIVVVGITLYLLAISTAVGNALVIHAIRTEKCLQTVSIIIFSNL